MGLDEPMILTKTYVVLTLVSTFVFAGAAIGGDETRRAQGGHDTVPESLVAEDRLPAVEAAPRTGLDAKPGQSQPPQLYIPPPRSTPQGIRLVGAGTRRGAGVPEQTPFAPDHVGLTRMAQPTFFWSSSGASDLRVDFILTNVESGQVVVESKLAGSVSEGIHSVSLADLGISLEPETTYRWFVVLVVDEDDRAQDVISAAAVRRVSSSVVGEDWTELAQNSIWYDAIAQVSAKGPREARNSAALHDLLNAAGIDFALADLD